MSALEEARHPELARRAQEPPGVDEIAREKARDALAGDLVERHVAAEREAREKRELVRRVVAPDVARRVGLRVAEPLRLGENLVVGAPRLLHLREDEIARAVQDAGDRGHAVSREARAERSQDRNPSRDRGLDAEAGAFFARERLQRGPVPGEEHLVRRHDTLARVQRGADEAVRGLDSAEQLDDEVDPRVRRDGSEVVRPAHAGPEAWIALSVRIAVRDGHERETDTAPGAEIGRLPREEARERPAHRAEADQADANGP